MKKNNQESHLLSSSLTEINISEHIESLKDIESFNIIIGFFSLPPELQVYSVYFSMFHDIQNKNSFFFIKFLEDQLESINDLIKEFELELLIAKFKCIPHEKLELCLMQNVFEKRNINQNTYSIEKHPITELKLLKLKNQFLENKISILESKINRKINLKPPVISIIYGGLKEYFIKEQREQLEKILNGSSANVKICFSGNQSQLAELFRRLKYSDQLDSTYSEIRDWLCANFTYSKLNKQFNLKSVYEILIAKGGKDIARPKRILKNEFPYKKADKVRVDKQN